MKNLMTLYVVALLWCTFAQTSFATGTPDWWDNPGDANTSWLQSTFDGHVENTGAQTQYVIAILDVPNNANPDNTKDVWMRVEWEVTLGTGGVTRTSSDQAIKWSEDDCPATSAEPLTGTVHAGFMSYEDTFTPVNEIPGDPGNTFDNGDEFSYQITPANGGQPGCERIELKFQVNQNSRIYYHVDVQTVCWGVAEISGGCPGVAPNLHEGAEDIKVFEFAMNAGSYGNGYWTEVTLCRAANVDDADIESIEIKTAAGVTIAGPVAWNPTTYHHFVPPSSIFNSQTFDITDQLILDSDSPQTFEVYVDLSSNAVEGDSIGFQIYNEDDIVVTEPATKSTANYPITCSSAVGPALAVHLSSFSAVRENNQVLVQWSSDLEVNHAGYNLYRGSDEFGPFTQLNYQLIMNDMESGPGAKHYEYVDKDVPAGALYYKLEAISLSGESTLYDLVSVQTTSGVNDDLAIPIHNALYQNYPNPFNPTTSISYSLRETQHVNIAVYNIKGDLVKQLASGYQDAGLYNVTWDATNDAGQKVTTGVYFYRIKAGSFTDTKKMTLMQ